MSLARSSGFPAASTPRRAKRCNAATGSQPFLQTVLREEHARSSMRVNDLRRARAMRCMACGEEMRLTRVVRDETCERHTLHCLGCEEVERPLVLLAPRHGAGGKDNQADQKFAPSSAWARAVAALRGVGSAPWTSRQPAPRRMRNGIANFRNYGTSRFPASDSRKRPERPTTPLHGATSRDGISAGACGSTRRKRTTVRLSVRCSVRPAIRRTL